MSADLAKDPSRTRAGWLMALPYLWFATPTVAHVWWGALLAVAGVAIRAWAAGTVAKGRELATTGPYAFVRHPLYLGGALIGAGVAIGGGHWIWPLTIGVFLARMYRATIGAEEAFLEQRFGAAYRDYRSCVPALVPSMQRYRGAEPVSHGFSVGAYVGNGEWHVVLGAAAVFGWLAAKVVLDV